ncbi:MAG: hypothetical protein LBQ00_06975 [Syntrophobacterales bacterium]|jgi:hypothetical protein|nr:hypothetical protein [Syntrophobacterales bacterium]
MKKTVIVLLALFLALPAVSFAGSATSKWDMTIGGYVKFDMGWGSQAQGQDAYVAQRKGWGPFETAADQTGNFYMYGGETRLNFLVKGPDAWGAKTSAFIEGHFRGNETSNSATAQNQGSFTLRHAYMQFDWANTKLLIGQTWQKWGVLPTYAGTILEYNGIGPFLKGSRQPLVRVEQNFAKNWNWALGVISSANTLGSDPGSTPTGVVNSYTKSQLPFFEGSIGWTTDKCGSIGPWQMLFNLEGFYGRQKMTYSFLDSLIGDTNLLRGDKDVNAYGIAFKGFIPIIPEKKGNKQGALSLSGVVFYAQNPGWFMGPATTQTYNYNPYGGYLGLYPAYHTPTTYGGWGQLSYWFTDKFYANGWFGYTRNNLSSYYGNGDGSFFGAPVNANAIQNTTQVILNLSYDVNAAIRFGIEGAYFNTRYAGYQMSNLIPGVPVGQKDGTYYTVRVGAFYFF